MIRNELDKLSLNEQIDYLNSELKKGISFNALCKKIGIPKSTLRSRISRKNYYYNIEIKQIEKNNTYNENYKSIPSKNFTNESEMNKSSKQVHSIEVHKSTPGLKQLINFKENIIELAKVKDNIVEMLNDYNLNKNIIDIPELKINNENFNGNIKAKTFKVYKSVLDDFIEFSEKNNYKMQDLISQAIYEFVNKYKK